MKISSTFFGKDITEPIRSRAGNDTPAGCYAKELVTEASWWMDKSYEELYSLMFGPTLKRSWFVLSYGSCPSCGGSVPMYNWIIDPKRIPWKVECPHCTGLFPKNDFAAYYASGIDSAGVFDRSLADSSLLINADGTGFGVDDGNGYVDHEGETWRFIGAYLAHGFWPLLVLDGIETLATAYFLSGNQDYARRAAIMLFRVSELFPDFDFSTQGVMYDEEGTSSGYVNYWVNTCHDIRRMTLAYDMIFEGIRDDEMLEEVLGHSWGNISGSIEGRIFQEALAHPEKYDSNPPDPSNVRILIKAVLGWPESRDEVLADFDVMIELSTRVDGLVGEKGLSAYAAIAPLKVADMLLLFANIEPDFLDHIIRRYPILEKTYRFHINTWYMNTYFPGCGDAGAFNMKYTEYPATLMAAYKQIPYQRTREWFTWKLYEYFDDPAFAQAVYISNGGSADGCFEKDLYLNEPAKLRRELVELIDLHGVELDQESVNYDEWRIAVLHSGSGENKRMISMGYDSGANHAHHDALNINLFFRGANISPDFGYPPVNHGGWYTPEVEWCRHPASHNLVVIDGKDHANLPDGKFLRYPAFGKTLLWHTGGFAQAVYADAAEYADVERFERLIGLVDVSGRDAYVVDIFRVKGGYDHEKFFRTLPARVGSSGLNMAPGKPQRNKTFMRNFKTDADPAKGWEFDFTFDDEQDLRLSYTELTNDASATLCESWVDITRAKQGPGNREIWIPAVIARRTGPESTFVSLLVPYSGASPVLSVRRVENGTDSDVVLEVKLANGITDLILAADPGGIYPAAKHTARSAKRTVRFVDRGFETDSPFCAIRLENDKVIDTSIPDGFSYWK
ncbi:MAG: hypothetical protein HN368_16450 [Spirochaetales bacterium]|nr:hypothetical protein [Spirochaetales bacterium]